MMTRKLAVALVAAAGVAAQAALLHAVVLSPLGSAMAELRAPVAARAEVPAATQAGARAASFEETIEVVAKAPAKAKPAKRS